MPEGLNLFTEIGILIGIAALVAFAMRILRQPLLIGHIITGLLVGPLVFNVIKSTEVVALFGEIGIAFLLFTVGLNLHPGLVREFGKVAVVTGVGQVLLTAAAGYGIALLIGFSHLTAFYLGVALAFSSTIIIMKLLHDKGELDSLYARISIGFLLVQDLIAIVLIFLLPLLSQKGEGWIEGSASFLLGVGLIGAVLFLGSLLLPRLNRFIAGSQELLLLFSIAWGIGFAALFREFGFSLESGALISGVALASLPSRREVASRLAPLRDFFIVLFFIFLGSQMALTNLRAVLIPGIIFSLLVIVGNPIILMGFMGFMGYKKKTSFQTGLTVAQISEFSLILVALGVKLGHIPQETLSLTTFVGLVTIFISTYLISKSDGIYRRLSPILYIFERAKSKEKEIPKKIYPILIFGSNRIGHSFVKTFQKIKKDFLVIDYNPEIVERLSENGVDAFYGDADDVEFLESLDLESVTIAISTIPSKETNMLLATTLHARNQNAVVMAVAHTIEDAFALYGANVDYVIMPHFLGGSFAASLAEELLSNPDFRKNLKHEHLAHLRERYSFGHEHPATNEQIS